jgi:tRNA (Thr-GGU) A37 N-methylase
MLRILFVFHKNNGHYTGAKVRPPRLDGAKVGLFATRCPYRPNPVGLTLARIDRIEGPNHLEFLVHLVEFFNVYSFIHLYER